MFLEFRCAWERKNLRLTYLKERITNVGKELLSSNIKKSSLNAILPSMSSKNELFLSILFSHFSIGCWSRLTQYPRIYIRMVATGWSQTTTT